MSDFVERRQGPSVDVVAERLDNHMRECAIQSAEILRELREFRGEVKPLVQVWQAGGVAVKLVKIIALFATAIAAVYALFRLKS